MRLDAHMPGDGGDTLLELVVTLSERDLSSLLERTELPVALRELHTTACFVDGRAGRGVLLRVRSEPGLRGETGTGSERIQQRHRERSDEILRRLVKDDDDRDDLR